MIGTAIRSMCKKEKKSDFSNNRPTARIQRHPKKIILLRINKFNKENPVLNNFQNELELVGTVNYH